MELRWITINGIKLDVYYEFSSINDPYGTGDSPTQYDVEIKSIELQDSPTDIYELLDYKIIEQITSQIIRAELQDGKQ